MSNKRRHTELVGVDEILRVSAQSGTIRDRWGNALTLTAMDTFKYGNIRAMEFNGSISKVDCGDIDLHTSAKTFVFWLFPRSYGESGGGRVLDNGKQLIYLHQPGTCFSMYTDSVLKSSAGGSVKIDQWQMLAITMTAAGILNFYIDAELSGAANQDAGAPVDGTTNLIIGNNNGQSATFDGLIEPVRIYDGLLTAQQISQLWSSTKKWYQQ